jgi:glycosyltransferase involved in cell wall biosynthesis
MEFVLAQDYRNIEVIISDNASTDDTSVVCEQLRQRDPRVRYIRQSTNIGPIPNYMAVLEAASGELYIALADDDWIAPNYVSACVEALLDSPELVLVCGKSTMYRNGELSHESVTTSLLSDSAVERVIEYYRTVSENGAFHGVVRRDILLRLPRLTNVLAGDWLWMASIAYQGKIATLSSTKIMKHQGGTTASWDNIVATLRLPQWQARYWSEAILISIGRDILTSPVYRSLSWSSRFLLMTRVLTVLGRRFNIWHRWRQYARELALPSRIPTVP